MEFKKIQISKTNTLNVVYRNGDGDTITMVGGNIVHRDLKEAFKALIPHVVFLTEQREATGATLKELQEQSEWEEKSIFIRMRCDLISISEDTISISGTRILDRGDIIKVNTPSINLVDDEKYEYKSDLALAVENIKYEAEEYVKEKKWGLKEGTLDFGEAGDPFEGKDAGEVPDLKVELNTSENHKEKKSKKKKEPEPAMAV